VDVALTSTLVLTFNEPVTLFSGFIEFVPRLSGATIFANVTDMSVVSVDNAGPFIVSVIPANGFVSGVGPLVYDVVLPLGVVVDSAGLPFAGFVAGSFWFSVEDSSAPLLLSSFPSQNEVSVTNDVVIVLTFNEPVSPGLGYFSLTSVGGELWTIGVMSSAVAFSGSTVSINPSPDLLSLGQDYDDFSLTVPTGAIVDQSSRGDAFLGLTLNFTVVNAFVNTTVSAVDGGSGANTTYRVSFFTRSAIENFDDIIIQFPFVVVNDPVSEHGFVIPSGSMLNSFKAVEPVFASIFVMGYPSSRRVLVQVLGGEPIPANTHVVFDIRGIVNPNVLGFSAFFSIKTTKMNGFVLDYFPYVMGVNITNERPPVFTRPAFEVNFAETDIFSETTLPPSFEPSVVAQVVATDSDGGLSGVVSYSIVSAMFGGAPFDWTTKFDFNETLGILTAVDYINFVEATPSYVLTVEARDSAPPYRSVQTTLTVTILDVNEFTPVFQLQDPQALSYGVVIKENSALGAVVLTVSATDLDSGLNGLVRYGMLSGSFGDFTLNPSTGQVIVARALNRAQQSMYLINVSASDSASAPLTRSSTTLLSVNVLSADVLTSMSLRVADATAISGADLQSYIQSLLCPGIVPTCRVVIDSVTSTPVGSRHRRADNLVVLFYVVSTFDVNGNPISYFSGNSTDVVSGQLVILDSHVVTDKLNIITQGGLIGSNNNFTIVAFTPGDTETKVTSPWYNKLGIAGMVLIPMALFLWFVLIMFLVYRHRNPALLTFVDKRPVDFGRRNKALFPARASVDPLAVLYDGDQDFFGRQFANPLHERGNQQRDYWDMDLDNTSEEGAFMSHAAIMSGLGGLAPAMSRQPRMPRPTAAMQSPGGHHGVQPLQRPPMVYPIFDASARDPATGRVYYYNTETGDRSWTY
jgi:hypothetical protein